MDGFAKDGAAEPGFDRLGKDQIYPAAEELLQKQIEIHVGVEGLPIELDHEVEIARGTRRSAGCRAEPCCIGWCGCIWRPSYGSPKRGGVPAFVERPPLAQERIELLADGRIALTVAHPWADGTRALVFGGAEFLEKLAVLIPKPRGARDERLDESEMRQPAR